MPSKPKRSPAARRASRRARVYAIKTFEVNESDLSGQDDIVLYGALAQQAFAPTKCTITHLPPSPKSNRSRLLVAKGAEAHSLVAVSIESIHQADVTDVRGMCSDYLCCLVRRDDMREGVKSFADPAG